MKILIATGIYPPSIGGPATYSKMLVDELPKQGIEVALISFDEVRHLPKIIRHLVFFVKVAFKLRGIDLVYAQDPVSVGLPAQLASQLFFKPFMMRLGGDYAWEQGTQRFGVKDSLDIFAAKQIGYAWPVLLMKRIQIHVAFWSQAIVVPSEYLKKIIVSWGIRPQKIHVINNAFEFPKEITHSSEIVATETPRHSLISIGRLVPWKGFYELIEVVAEAQKTLPAIDLAIIGDGPEKERLQNLIKEKGLEKTVTLYGSLPRPRTLELCRAAKVFVLNTGYEGFSHIVLEAMAIGTPVITTDAGGNTEIVNSGINGVAVPLGDKEALKKAIIELLNDSELRQRFSVAGKEKIKEFALERVVSELVILLHTVHG